MTCTHQGRIYIEGEMGSPEDAEMSEKLYAGHKAVEVIELMGMLAAQYNIHSADEALSIVEGSSNESRCYTCRTQTADGGVG